MTFNEAITIVVLIFLVYFCLYSIVDRVCQCCEKCAFNKFAGHFYSNNDEKSENIK